VVCLQVRQRVAGSGVNSLLRKFEDAKKRIEKTMEWRRDFKPDLIPPEEVPVFNRLCESLVLSTERSRIRFGLRAKRERCKGGLVCGYAFVADDARSQHPYRIRQGRAADTLYATWTREYSDESSPTTTPRVVPVSVHLDFDGHTC